MTTLARRQMLIVGAAAVVGATLQSPHAREQSKVPIPKQPETAPPRAPSHVSLITRAEPGERLVYTGRVLDGDSGTAIRSASIFAYNTDITGHYDPVIDQPGAGNPRLRGYMRSDRSGRFRFITVRPGAYPRGNIPPHIHLVVNVSGYKPNVFEVQFKGDELDPRGCFSQSSHPGTDCGSPTFAKDASGVWQLHQDIIMRRL